MAHTGSLIDSLETRPLLDLVLAHAGRGIKESGSTRLFIVERSANALCWAPNSFAHSLTLVSSIAGCLIEKVQGCFRARIEFNYREKRVL